MEYILKFQLVNSKSKAPRTYYLRGLDKEGAIKWDTRKEEAWVMDFEKAELWRSMLLSRSSVLSCVIEPVNN
jgi:hypothetical protein